MADDMEISSEHGQVTGDDIDIDIDFTAGQADEDYILQDAQPSVDYENEFPPQQSPMHHDDPMVDDDSASYQMEDADLVHEEVVQDAGPEQMSFATSDIPPSGVDVGNAVDAITYSEDHDIGLFEEQDSYGYEAPESDFVLVPGNDSHENIASNTENFPVQDDSIATNKVVDDAEKIENNDSQPESHESTPPHRSSAAAQEEPRSPLASTSIPGPSSPIYEPNGLVLDPSHISQEDSVNIDEPDPSKLTLDLSKASDVKVIYQSVEYALFSTSDLDDPDFFFLSDLTVMEKPLDQFFQAIREIIHDDLTAEDELCLTVEDLGLKTDEASSSLQDVSIAQILNVHQKLLHNDGPDTMRPLYLLLSTRTSFSKRFTNLARGASEGKGLSELVIRDESSESFDDEEPEEATEGVESILQSHETSENAEDGSTHDIEISQARSSPPTSYQVEGLETYEEEYQHPKGDEEFEQDQEGQDAENEAAFQEDHEKQHKTQEEEQYREVYGVEGETEPESRMPITTDYTHKSESANDDTKSHDGSQQPINHTDFTEILPNPAQETVSGADNDEEGGEEDLIDYSDEEIQFPDELVGYRTAAVADANRTDNEYQAKDDELRRRSISRQAEERLSEQSADQSFTRTNGDEEYAAETETGIDEYHPEFPPADQSDDYEFAEHAGQANVAGHEDDQIGMSNDLETFEDDEETYVYDPESGIEGDHDFNADFPRSQSPNQEEAELQGIPPHTEEGVQAEVSDFGDVNVIEVRHKRPAHSTASSLGAAETAESSVTLGAEEIRYEDDDFDEEISNEQEANAAAGSTNGSVLEQKDEIDYEDDEDEEIPIPTSSGAITVTRILSNSNGKRSIAEVESVISTPTKDAKRPRS